jgi:hypothetical protein
LRLPADELEAPLRIGDGGTVVNDVLLFRDFFMFMSSSLPGLGSLLSENGFSAQTVSLVDGGGRP